MGNSANIPRHCPAEEVARLESRVNGCVQAVLRLTVRSVYLVGARIIGDKIVKLNESQTSALPFIRNAEIYRHSGDTLGIRYDKDIYEFATKTGNEVLRHAAAVRCAEYYMKARSTRGPVWL